MKDKYPEVIEFDVERDLLRKFLRKQWFYMWIGLAALPGFFIGLLVALPKQHEHFEYKGILDTMQLVSRGVGTGILISISIAFALYFLTSYRYADRVAKTLRVIVEGPFLRIVQFQQYSTIDRKIHFRAIVDYATVGDDKKKKSDLSILRMTTIGGGLHSTIQIAGLSNCEKVRDMLVEIDSIREID